MTVRALRNIIAQVVNYFAMKKYLLLCGILVISLVIAGCASKPRISSLELKVDDGSVAPEYFSATDLMITPDYDKRELKLNYSKSLPEGQGEDVTSEGTVGGDYFDRFELLEDSIYSGDMDSLDPDKDFPGFTGGGTFDVLVVGKDGQNKDYSLGVYRDEDMVEDFRSFYLDLVNLLTESVPV